MPDLALPRKEGEPVFPFSPFTLQDGTRRLYNFGENMTNRHCDHTLGVEGWPLCNPLLIGFEKDFCLYQ